MTPRGIWKDRVLNRLEAILSKKYQHTFLMELPPLLSSSVEWKRQVAQEFVLLLPVSLHGCLALRRHEPTSEVGGMWDSKGQLRIIQG